MELELKLDILEEQTGTFSTFADLYGYDVFSEDFTEDVESYKKEHEAEKEEYFQNVFGEEQENKTEEAFEAVFSAEMQTVVRNEYQNQSKENAGMGFAVAFTLMGMFLAGGIMFLIEKLRKRKKSHATDNHDHWNQYEKV